MSIDKYGPQRERIDADELQMLAERGVVALDSRRTRPLWFDGRFLKAGDLSREQNYFLTRQADLASAVGGGAVEGLMVSEGSRATRLNIDAGHGVTAGGERVVISRSLTLELANIPLIEQLNLELGLSKEAAPPLRARSGLFIVALRALEYTANPTTAYPTHVDAERSVEDGEIIEATAVTLVPFSLSAGISEAGRRRAAAAYRIFNAGGDPLAPVSTLPLAMLELSQGKVRWVDNHMVRRRMGSTHSDVLGFGMAPRPLREAHYRQYQEMLNDLIVARSGLGGQRFAASEYFYSLPPAGQMPAASLDMQRSVQHFFPPEVEVELTLVPEDEIPALVEESLLMPPIDLGASEETLESTSVLVAVPVPRRLYAATAAALRPRRVMFRRLLNLSKTRMRPAERLLSVRARLPSYVKPDTDNNGIAAADWAGLVAGQERLWFLRRRNLSLKPEIEGEAAPVTAEEFTEESSMRRKLYRLKVGKNFTELKRHASARADLQMVNLLVASKFRESEVMTRGAIAELEKRLDEADKLDEASVLKIAARYADAETGEGIRRVEATVMESGSSNAVKTRNRRRAELLGKSLRVAELDWLALRMRGGEFAGFSQQLRTRLDQAGTDATDVADMIDTTKQEFES